MKKLVIGILAHVDAGKTTLSESILYITGIIRKLGRVDNKDAFLDTYELERARGITIFSKQAVFSLGNKTVTLMDTPGHVDFSAEMERTLQILDYAILVISGTDGVQGHTETLWRLLRRYNIPTFIFINKMDITDRDNLIDELKKRLNENCIDFGLERKQLWESLAMSDEQLLEYYLENETITHKDICKLIANRKVFPCYFGSALKLQGIEEFLNGLEEYVECPQYTDKFGAKIYKISRDDQGNRLSHMKITGGKLKVKDLIGSESEKVNQIRVYSGQKYEAIQEAECGTVCAVTGPVTTYTGQGVGTEKESELPILEPVLNYRITLPQYCDVHKMLKNLRQLEEEEPQLNIIWNDVLEEIQAQVMGEVQIEILKSLIKERFGVDVEFDAGNIIYKETIDNTVEGVGHFEPLRHYAEVHVLMQPTERGSGLQFEADCSEDILDRNWQRLVLTHLEEKRHVGVLTGSEITDIKITLITGRAHIKHTEGGDFREATYRAVRQGLKEAECILLEPYYSFRLELPTEFLGRAMSDIEKMKGAFNAPQHYNDMSIITGSAPVVNMRDYQIEVISYTKGRGRLSLSLKGYERCHNYEEVIESIGYDSESDIQNPTGSIFCGHGSGYYVPWYDVKSCMHVESLLQSNNDNIESNKKKDSFQNSSIKSSDYYSLVDDEELEKIFIRTFGEQKNKNTNINNVSKQTIYPNNKKSNSSNVKESSYNKQNIKEYLLVDGYNIIFAWDELKKLSETTIDGARYKLMDILSNYQGYKKCTVIVVFDAYKVVGNIGHSSKYHNIHVVYTKEAETADQYIEKLANDIGRKYDVTVATSDRLEQLIIYGRGCKLMSASDLKKDIERVNKQIRHEQEKLKHTSKNYLSQYVDDEMKNYLEDMRLGKNKDNK